MVETGEHNLLGVNEKPNKPKKKNRGCLIGCLGLIVLFFIHSAITMKLSAPQYFGDKDKVIEDIYRYKERYSHWPQSLEVLKSKLPDYHFKHNYGYSHNDDMFIVSFLGKGFAGDHLGDFYRSDTKEWKSIYGNRQEYQILVKEFYFKNNDKLSLITDIYRYKNHYGHWPQSLEELKSKFPDHHFEDRYDYSHNDDMFIAIFRGSGLASEGSGNFYRSDTKEWKSIYENRKEYQILEKEFFPKK